MTAGVALRDVGHSAALEGALLFLRAARDQLEGAGYVVQTLRTATQPLLDYASGGLQDATIEGIRRLEGLAGREGAGLSVGPVHTRAGHEPRLAGWSADLARATSGVYFSVRVEGPAADGAALTAAETILALAAAVPGGEANFRFAAASGVPPHTPFYPVAWHAGEPAFSIGLESAGIVGEALAAADGPEDAARRLHSRMTEELQAVEALARGLARDRGWRFAGIDVSPAPSLEASIGAAIEGLSGAPFGSPSTLEACALVTEVLQHLPVTRCGYSGLMLPVLEDEVLARRASEGRFGVQDVLLYSSVCGTGLDVIPLPGDVSAAALAALIRDVAALSRRLRKPLAARLLPIPGAAVGDRVAFDNPHLTACAVMALQ